MQTSLPLPPAPAVFLQTTGMPQPPPAQQPLSPHSPPPQIPPKSFTSPLTTALPVPSMPPRKPSDPNPAFPFGFSVTAPAPSGFTRPASPPHSTTALPTLPSAVPPVLPAAAANSGRRSPIPSRVNTQTIAAPAAAPTSPPSPSSSSSSSSSSAASSASYACLTHLWDQCYEQSDAGLYTVKRMSSLLSKLAAHQLEYGKSVQRSIEQEHSRHAADFAADNMRSCVSGWEAVMDSVKLSSRHAISIAERITADVIAPLSDFHSSAASRLQEIAKEKKNSEKEMARAHAAVQSELTACNRLLAQIDSMREEGKSFTPVSSSQSGTGSSFTSSSTEKKGGGGLLSKLQSRIEKVTLSTPAALNERLTAQAVKYQQAIDRANARQTAFLQSDLPSVLSSLESLERQRLCSMSAAVQKLSAVYESCLPEETEILRGITAACRGMQAEADISSLVQGFIMLHGPAPAPVVYTYALPCSPADIRAGRYEGNANSVFNTTVSHAMELEPADCDGLPVPRLVAECLRAVRRNDGLRSEGIFRLSPSKAQFEEAKSCVLKGDYSALERLDAYVSAAMLKDWMRSLSAPLIPDGLYEEAVKVARDDLTIGAAAGGGGGGAASGVQGALAVFRRLDDCSRNVLTVVAKLAKELTLPHNADSNKMSVSSNTDTAHGLPAACSRLCPLTRVRAVACAAAAVAAAV